MTFVLGHGVFLILGLWLVTTLPFIGASSRRDRTQSVTPVLSPGIKKFHDLCPFNAFMQLVFQTPSLRDRILLSFERDSDSWCRRSVVSLMERMLISNEPIDANIDIVSAILQYHLETKRSMLEPETYEDTKAFMDWLVAGGLSDRARELFRVDLEVSHQCKGQEFDQFTCAHRIISVSLAPKAKEIQLTDYIKGQLNKVEVMDDVRVKSAPERKKQSKKALEHDTEDLQNRDKIKRVTSGRISGPLLGVNIKRDYKSERTTPVVYEEVMEIDKTKWYLHGIIIYKPGFHFYSIARTGYGEDYKKDEWHTLDDSLVTKSSRKEVLKHNKDVLWLIYVREDQLDQWRTAALERTGRPALPAFTSESIEAERSLEAPQLPYDAVDRILMINDFLLTEMNTENSLSAKSMLKNFRENGALRSLYPEQDNSDSKSFDSQSSKESRDSYLGKSGDGTASKKSAEVKKKFSEEAADEDTEKDHNKVPREKREMSKNHKKRLREVSEDDSELEQSQTKKLIKLKKNKDLGSERRKESKKHEKKEVSEDDSEPKQKKKAKKHDEKAEKKHREKSRKVNKRDPESERKKESRKKHSTSLKERSESKRDRSTKKP